MGEVIEGIRPCLERAKKEVRFIFFKYRNREKDESYIGADSLSFAVKNDDKEKIVVEVQ